ncbi:Sugar fermentation stimulation protein A [Stanieria cyanosphaera PCC 7437]|uniref:Sugar fermentation stimulation protein homolog n=1 Tax=Stanieria cyanosphaera (strain ATCC 29371 / PCC 7437) TaxID=111780 RepID=K9XV01_STAC7|nr:DNA/RNA nuclease SfsA [Stanieria cyanosphaera]AFZ35889.1 Sugar fermentation stimulation protein A [Stanieria cyanosphaera PCC 7437]
MSDSQLINSLEKTDYIYQYPLLISGTLIKRYKRFFADIQLNSGEIITAHCPNTGPMTGVCTPGSLVQISTSNNPKRKLPYTWEMIQVNNTWVGINTGLPNKIVKLALHQNLFTELTGRYQTIVSEIIYGQDQKSRIDFLLTGTSEQIPIYLEVKNVTLTQRKIALFPDTVTTRGQKHLRELIALLPTAQPVMLYFINRGDCLSFAPGDNYDFQYGELFRKAVIAGVEMLPYRFEINPQGIRYLGKAQLLNSSPSI